MRQIIVLAVIGMFAAINHAGAQSIDADATRGSAAEGSVAVVQPAPGGGEMVILGPESHYVTRAWRNHDGHMQCGCTREDVDTAERVRTAERP